MKLLSDREITCLFWAAIGKTSWEIGVIVDLSERTVNFHIHNACRKLGVHSRQAAITVSLQAGLLPKQANLLPVLKKTPQKISSINHPYLAGKASPRKNSSA